MKRLDVVAVVGLLFASGCELGDFEEDEINEELAAESAAASCSTPGCLDVSFSGNGQLQVPQLGYGGTGGFSDVVVMPRGTVVALGEWEPFNVTNIVVDFFT